jgi:hypothetical protein
VTNMVLLYVLLLLCCALLGVCLAEWRWPKDCEQPVLHPDAQLQHHRDGQPWSVSQSVPELLSLSVM